MKSPELKNIFIAAGIAVFAGVLVLGVNAAFGVSAPTATPEGSGLVGPTFSDVTVNNDLDVEGTIKNSQVDAEGDDQPVVVDDLLWLNEPLFVHEIGDSNRWGGLTISSLGSINISPFGGIALNSVISSPEVDSSGNQVPLTVGDDFSVDGTISSPVTDPGNPNGNVRIDDSLVVTGNTVIGSVADRSNLNVNGNINVIGDIENPTVGTPTQPVVIDDPLYVTEHITFDTYTIGPNIYVNDIISRGALTLYLNRTNGESVQIGSSGNTSGLTVYGDLSASGAVTAQSFGSIYYRFSSRLAISPGSSVSASATCNSGDRILSCGAQTSLYSNGEGIPTNIMLTNIRPDITNTCYARATNTGSSGTRYILAVGICISPDG